MILAAGLLVLVGLGLFVAGLLTEVTAFYWACVAVCVIAAVVLYLARRRMTAPSPAPVAAAAVPAGRHAGATAATPAPAEQVAPAAAAAAESSAAVSGPPTAVPDPTMPAAAPSTATTGGNVTHTGTAASAVTRSARAEPVGVGRSSTPSPGDAGEPPVEEVEVTDLSLVVALADEVLVVDEHPRYHVEGCRHLSGQETIPIPMDEARTDGFTPCGTCRPDATLAERVRSRKRS